MAPVSFLSVLVALLTVIVASVVAPACGMSLIKLHFVCVVPGGQLLEVGSIDACERRLYSWTLWPFPSAAFIFPLRATATHSACVLFGPATFACDIVFSLWGGG